MVYGEFNVCVIDWGATGAEFPYGLTDLRNGDTPQ